MAEVKLTVDKFNRDQAVDSKEGTAEVPSDDNLPARVSFSFSSKLASEVKYESFQIGVTVTLPCGFKNAEVERAVERAEQLVFNTFDYHAERLTRRKFQDGKEVSSGT